VDDEDSDTEDGLPQDHMSQWKPLTLAVQFSGQKEKFLCMSTQSLDQWEDDLNEAIADINGQG